jgi:hypothetical protein
MQAHRAETTLSEDGVLTLRGLPFARGESVEVIIQSSPSRPSDQTAYPLRGTSYTYIDPFGPAAEGACELHG